MASKQANVDFVVEQMADAGDVSARKMFGEYGIYLRGKIIALFCDDQLFVKPTTAGKTYIGKVREGSPYPGAKPWLLITGDECEDGEWLAELARVTERELPAPKPKISKGKTAKSKSAKPPATKAKPQAKGKAKTPSARGARATKKTPSAKKTRAKKTPSAKRV